MQLAADQVSEAPSCYRALARQLREHGDPLAPLEARPVPRQRRAPRELLAPVCVEKQRGWKMRSWGMAYWSYECGEASRKDLV